MHQQRGQLRLPCIVHHPSSGIWCWKELYAHETEAGYSTMELLQLSLQCISADFPDSLARASSDSLARRGNPEPRTSTCHASLYVTKNRHETQEGRLHTDIRNQRHESCLLMTVKMLLSQRKLPYHEAAGFSMFVDLCELHMVHCPAVLQPSILSTNSTVHVKNISLPTNLQAPINAKPGDGVKVPVGMRLIGKHLSKTQLLGATHAVDLPHAPTQIMCRCRDIRPECVDAGTCCGRRVSK
jgi:hypothetical protein